MPGTRWDLEAAGIECDGKGQGTEAVQPLATGGDPWRRRRQMYSLFPSRLGAVAHTGGERRFHYSGVFSLVFAQNTLGFEGSPAVPRRRQATLIFLFFFFFLWFLYVFDTRSPPHLAAAAADLRLCDQGFTLQTGGDEI